MFTNAPPRKANHAGFLESDQIKTFDLPHDRRLLSIAKSVEAAMKAYLGSGLDPHRRD
jgi:hypothetical protein